MFKKFEHFGKIQIMKKIKNNKMYDSTDRFMRFKTLCSGKVNLNPLKKNNSCDLIFNNFHPYFSQKAAEF